MQTLQVGSGHDMEFRAARVVAGAEASRFFTEPMVLSWLNRQTGQHSPNVNCCDEGDKEAWEIYAESRGGTLRVEIGDKYVFIFREGTVVQ
ncbi:AF1514 family protein [Chloroflexota bacterium]